MVYLKANVYRRYEALKNVLINFGCSGMALHGLALGFLWETKIKTAVPGDFSTGLRAAPEFNFTNVWTPFSRLTDINQ